MGDAYECDRCGELHPGKPASKIEKKTSGLSLGTAVSLSGTWNEMCKECTDSFDAWFSEMDREPGDDGEWERVTFEHVSKEDVNVGEGDEPLSFTDVIDSFEDE